MKFNENKNFFIGLKPRANLQKCRFFVLPVPFEKTTTYGKGTKNAPIEIINASNQLELYDSELKKSVYKKGIYTLKPIDCKTSASNVFKKINKTILNVSKYKATPFFIGGEHSITPQIVLPLIKKHKNLSILHFDAHADLRSSYDGIEYSHACAMHQISKKCKIVQVGIRSIAEEELKYINKGNVETFLMQDNLSIDKLIAKVLKALTDNVYISIDVDGFDPALIPATGTPEPGGFGWYDTLKLFKKVCQNKNIVGVDVVELSPIKKFPSSEFTIAKLIYKLMGYISHK
jgi:agmatinase